MRQIDETIANMKLHRASRSASIFASDQVYALIDEIDLLRRHRDELHLANDRYLERARDAEAKIREIAACFDAADADGLQKKINEVEFCHVGSLSDIVIRRLLPAAGIARIASSATTLRTAQPEPKRLLCAICKEPHDNDVLTDICCSCEQRINEEGSP